MIFKCKHPVNKLVVEEEATTQKLNGDFNKVTYHLKCTGCGKSLKIHHASMIGGVEGFLSRGRQNS